MQFVSGTASYDDGAMSPLSADDSTPSVSHKSKSSVSAEIDEVDNDDYNGNVDYLSTPLTSRSLATIGTGASETSGISLGEIESELHELIAKVNAGEQYNEKRLDQLILN